MNATSFGKRSHGGARLPHRKHTAELETVAMPAPQSVTILMSQHIGVPCKPVVKVGDMVKTGQLIGQSDKLISAPIYSSITGKVKAITEVVADNGSTVEAVVIAAEGEETLADGIAPPKIDTLPDFIAAVKASGLTGLGGAGFPAHVKLNPSNLSEIEFLIINAAECEPYITADYRTLMEDTDDVMGGILLVKEKLGIQNVFIGIEDNKPKAIELYTKLCADKAGVSVAALRSRYPQGAEKTLIYETTGRVVEEGKLPSSVGCIVMNVSSVAFLNSYIRTGVPLIKRRLTVDGGAVNEPKNLIAPIGTSVKDIIDFCGGYKEAPKKLLMGGPMMGLALPDDSYPTKKSTNAILAFTEKECREAPMTNCIRCARCVFVCPMSLMPVGIEKAYEARDVQTLKELKTNLCIECGSCSYVCPAKRKLVQSIKLGKALILEDAKKKSAQKPAEKADQKAAAEPEKAAKTEKKADGPKKAAVKEEAVKEGTDNGK
ncbi:electron transport complex subunit RsxC [Acetanaerobacterium elongatum]|uniref:Ion-translocating oxidoreductase complex subunit C n=1 Tax=Acetanaerobacterium elongatum TaxID=258515 RepID=A0A1G9XCJ6_9FIRM|nr:electron transport complex subunit RsxC [Acetanaerobacterium elongatum]SDM94176.1 electron transport complex protein RnfC [Acetanaerobacterium elongatum]